MSKPRIGPFFGISLGDAWDCPSGIRHVGGATLDRAPVWNARTWPNKETLDDRKPIQAQAAPTVRLKVPMRRRGADCLVVATKWGNAHGAKGVGHRRDHADAIVGEHHSEQIGRRRSRCGRKPGPAVSRDTLAAR